MNCVWSSRQNQKSSSLLALKLKQNQKSSPLLALKLRQNQKSSPLPALKLTWGWSRFFSQQQLRLLTLEIVFIGSTSSVVSISLRQYFLGQTVELKVSDILPDKLGRSHPKYYMATLPSFINSINMYILKAIYVLIIIKLLSFLHLNPSVKLIFFSEMCPVTWIIRCHGA